MTTGSGTPAGGDGVEIEWQFDALDLRPVERWLAALPTQPGATGDVGTVTAQAKPAMRLVDRYLDTADWRIGRAGYVLRIRHRGRREEATLKDQAPSGADGMRQRLEATEPLPEGGLAALDPSGPVARRINAVAGRRPFAQVLEVRTRRRPFSLRVAGEEVAELALDETVITVDPAQQPVRLRRVEVEVHPEWARSLAPMVADLRTSCGLQPATLSKFEAGMLAHGLAIPGPPDLGSTAITPDATLGDQAYAVLRRHLAVLLAREPGTRLGEDIEELHDMRVATRRLRAAIEFFADVLPARAPALRNELAWLAQVLGNVRDLDVQIERMDEMEQWVIDDGLAAGSPLDDLRTLLEAQRDKARRELLDALDSARWERLAGGLTTMVRSSPRGRPVAARQPAALALPTLVLPRHKKVVKAARRARASGEAADYHRLRIRCKRLRYSLEFTSDVYAGRTEPFTKKLAKLQDALGLLQDAEVATGRLLALATSPDPDEGLPPRTVFAMGAIADRYRVEAGHLLAKMPRRLELLKGSQWRGLAAHMSALQAKAGATVAPRPVPVPEPTPVPTPVEQVEPSSAADPAVAEPPTPAAAPAPATRPTPFRVPELAPPTELVAALAAWPDPAWGLSGTDSGEG